MSIRKSVVDDMVSDIKYLESMDVEIEWDSIDPHNYSVYPTDEEIKAAFIKCGYSFK